MRLTSAKFVIGCIALAMTTPCFGIASDGWKTRRIHDRFFAEGASAGDIDGDGSVDVVAGPVWYRGPAFNQKRS